MGFGFGAMRTSQEGRLQELQGYIRVPGGCEVPFKIIQGLPYALGNLSNHAAMGT